MTLSAASFILKGHCPNIMLKNMTPIDQISALRPYGLLSRTYGAIVVIVPNQVLLVISFSFFIFIILENPKSAILHSPLFINIFSGLRSLWIIFCLWHSPSPVTICFKMVIASSSGIFFLSSTLSLNVP